MAHSALAPIYRYLDPDDPDQQPTEIESFCTVCEQNGTTKILMIRIPFYKEVIVMSFSCDHCGNRNNEIQSGGQIMEKGVTLTLKVNTPEDLNREVIKSEFASVKIPEVDLEIPHKTQAGGSIVFLLWPMMKVEITTVEGIVRRVIDQLTASQDQRAERAHEQIDEYLIRLNKLLTGDAAFTIVIDDPSGNSFVENPNPAQNDTSLSLIRYSRTLDQNKMMALIADDVTEEDYQNAMGNAEQGSSVSGGDVRFQNEPTDTLNELKNEVVSFGVKCPNCPAQIDTKMKVIEIPHFKESILMSTNCDQCGYKSTEVKSAKGISEQACRLTLRISHAEDLQRDVIKSDTCALRIPELDVDGGMGVMVGKFTTVEGLLTDMRKQLSTVGNFHCGDSADPEKRSKMEEFLQQLDDVIELKLLPVHLILDDAAGNSYVQRLPGTNGDDLRLSADYYDRSHEQNEDLGLNDMRLKDYGENSK